LICHKCAQLGFGRTFCSPACAEFYFHGDDEDDDA